MDLYSSNELEQLHKLQLRMLGVFHRICTDNHLIYWADGGTALGAVRHGGFIPWDDDIDVSMTRDDYEKFKIVSKEHLSCNGLFLQDYTTESNIPYNYMKIRLDGTKFSEYCNRNLKMHQGIYIDIFPYDKVPKNDDKRHIQFMQAGFLEALWVLRQTPDRFLRPQNAKDWLKAFLRKMLHWSVQAVPGSLIQNKLQSVMTKYKDLDDYYLAYVCSPKLEFTNWEKTVFIPPKIMKFEDLEIMVPADIHAFLSKFFGNYMKLPPKDRQTGHRPFIFSLGRFEKNNQEKEEKDHNEE